MRLSPADLDARLARVFSAYLAAPEVPAALREAITYSLFAPGKRIRPRLTLAACGLLGVPDGAAWQAAAALEALHCASLIHDDLPAMDDDDFRRGRPTNHRVHGEARAILAGDALIVVGFEALTDAAREGCAPDAVQRALRRVLRAYGPAGLAGGQTAELGGVRDAAGLAAVRRMKTTVLFEAAILVAADLASPSPAEPDRRRLAELASAFGEAFQLADDLEDAGDDPAATNVLGYAGAAERVRAARRRLEAAAAAVAEDHGDAAAPLAELAVALAGRLHMPAAAGAPLAAAGGRS